LGIKMRLAGCSSDHTNRCVSIDDDTTRLEDGDHATLVIRAWWKTQSEMTT
jgi:hypothetical protein